MGLGVETKRTTDCLELVGRRGLDGMILLDIHFRRQNLKKEAGRHGKALKAQLHDRGAASHDGISPIKQAVWGLGAHCIGGSGAFIWWYREPGE